MVSARRASSPGSFARAAIDIVPSRCSSAARSFSATVDLPLPVSLSARSTLASADAVPDVNATKSKPIARTRATTGSSIERTRSASWARSRERRRIGARAGLGQADDAELQRRRVVQLLRVGEDDLERAAAEIEQRHPPLAEVQRAARAQVDEARLLVAADDADVDARLVARRAHELAAVLGLAHRAGRDRHQRVDVVAIGDAAKRAQGVQPAPEHLGRDHPVVQGRVAEPDHLLGAVEHVDVPARSDVRHDQVERVRADVERGDPHRPLR